MSIVSAYTDLPKGESAPLHSLSCWTEGELNSTGPEGLEVTWWGAYPEGAQVYIEWTPRVYAVWEEGEENGEDREGADGSNPVERDEAVPTEPDLGTGEGSAGDGDVPASG